VQQNEDRVLCPVPESRSLSYHTDLHNPSTRVLACAPIRDRHRHITALADPVSQVDYAVAEPALVQQF
jgi:hypothetical protein